MGKPVINIADLELQTFTQGTRYEGADASFGKLVGLRGLGISYNEVPPGKSSCPFHNHHVEDELFIVLEGEGTYRFGDSTYPVKAGDFLSAPAGRAEVAHQLVNTGDRTLRYFCVANYMDTNVVELPELGVVRISSRVPGGPARLEFPLSAAR